MRYLGRMYTLVNMYTKVLNTFIILNARVKLTMKSFCLYIFCHGFSNYILT